MQQLNLCMSQTGIPTWYLFLQRKLNFAPLWTLNFLVTFEPETHRLQTEHQQGDLLESYCNIIWSNLKFQVWRRCSMAVSDLHLEVYVWSWSWGHRYCTQHMVSTWWHFLICEVTVNKKRLLGTVWIRIYRVQCIPRHEYIFVERIQSKFTAEFYRKKTFDENGMTNIAKLHTKSFICNLTN